MNNEQVIKSSYCYLLSKRIVKILLLLTLTVFIITCSASTSKAGVLEIRDTDTGKVLGKWQLNEHEEFAIEFIHSVNKSPVRESFKIENGMIRLMSVRFYSYGAGIQSDLGEGQTLSREGDVMIISGYNTSFNELNIITGTESNHILFINNEIINNEVINNGVISLHELSKKTDKLNKHITIQYK